ncbi:MAG: ATP-binding protein [Chitinophagaceae bacterium]
MKQLFLYLMFMAVIPQPGSAQQLQITSYSPREGVPVYGINSVFQDSKGWIWMTSGYEVMQYDGHRFRIWPRAANTQMNFCFRIREVNKEIWVMAAPHILKVSGDSLRRLEYINDTVEIADHVQQNGQSYFLGKDGIYKMMGNQLTPYITAASLSVNSPNSLTTFSDSLLLSCQVGERLIIFNIKQKLFHAVNLAVTDIRMDKKRNVFIMVKGKGIMHLKQIKMNGNLPAILADPVVVFDETRYATFTVDSKGCFWTFNQFRELVKIGPGNEVRTFNESDGLPSLWFNDLFVDREENLWICFNSGLSKIRSTDLERYSTGEGLYSNHILFCTRGPGPGQIFVGTQNGVNLIEDKQVRQVKYRDKPFICELLITSPTTLYYSRDSFLFSGVMDKGAYGIKSEKLLAKLPGKVAQILKHPAAGLIIATTHGIYAYSNERLSRLTNDTNYFRKIMLDSKGRLWAGKFAFQLHCYKLVENDNGIKLVELFFLDSLSPSMPPLVGTRSLAESRQGDILVGTRNNGLFLLTVNNDKLVSTRHFGNENGLPSNTVWDIVVDTSGICWIATMNGLSRLKKINTDEWELSDEGIKRQLYQATLLFADQKNNIWVASHPGIVVTRNDPGSTKEPFSVSLTGVMVNGKYHSYDQGTGIKKLKHTDDNISIEFSANTYSQEETVLYSYRLNDKNEWTTPAATHQVNYSALRPGKYRFSVKAVNPDGQWSSNESNFAFEIMPPFWQRKGFIGLVILALAAGSYAFYRNRLNRIRELFEMRNIIASDLHDEIGSTLTSINILSKVSHNNLQNDQAKASSLLKKVIDQSQQIQENMGDIVWSIRPDNDKMENIILRMHEYLNHTLEPANVHIDFNVDDKINKESLTMQQRRDFFLIFKEAVNNVAKYSGCGKVEIRLSIQDGILRLVIRDDGKGFDPRKSKSSNGLRNMQHRAGLLKGKIEIRSVEGEGTSVELLLPATQ